ncbi:MAG: hypothetical protein MJK04_25245 [Psychrosphaera sp.]|nr:hypothetical protein [Psychrosphaera sp.]
MTTDEFTGNSVVLDPADLDGILDIARYGLDPLMNLAPTRKLLNKLVYRIAALSLGREIELVRYDPEAIDDFNDDDNPLEGGSIVLTVTPLSHLVGRE